MDAGAPAEVALVEAQEAWRVPSYKILLRKRTGAPKGIKGAPASIKRPDSSISDAPQAIRRAPVATEEAAVGGIKATLTGQLPNDVGLEAIPLYAEKEGASLSPGAPSKPTKSAPEGLTTKNGTWRPLSAYSGGSLAVGPARKPAPTNNSGSEGPPSLAGGPQLRVVGPPPEKTPLVPEAARKEAVTKRSYAADAFSRLVTIIGFFSIVAFCSAFAIAEIPKEKQQEEKQQEEQKEVFTPDVRQGFRV